MPPVFITHITEKASANNGKCASYSEHVPYREFNKMYETRYVYTKVHPYDYIPVARIQINTNHKYRFLAGTISIMI
jgi:hypothetical protein